MPEPTEPWGSFFDRLEAAWEEGVRPDLVAFLPDDPDLRRELLPDLAALDLDLSWKTAAPRYVHESFDAFPELLDDPEAAVRLIRMEVERRSYAGEVDLDEYRQRFPALAEELARFSPRAIPKEVARLLGPFPHAARSAEAVARDIESALGRTPEPGVKVEEKPDGNAPVFRLPGRWFSGLASVAALVLVFLLGRGSAPGPPALVPAALEVLDRPVMGETASLGQDLRIEAPFDGFATVVRVADGRVDVFPGRGEPPINIGLNSTNNRYGPLRKPRNGGWTLGVLVTDDSSATEFVRRVVAEAGPDAAARPDVLLVRVEGALLTSGRRRVAVARTAVRPPSETGG